MCVLIELCPDKTSIRRISELSNTAFKKTIKSKTSVKLVFEDLDLGSQSKVKLKKKF